MSKQHVLATFATGLVTILLGAATTNAQFLIDDFNDGNADGWTPIYTGEGEIWGPGIFDASSGRYNLRSTGRVQVGTVPPIASYWENSDNPIYANGYLRATIREEAGGTNLGLGMRIGEGGASGYLFTTAYNPRSIQIFGCTDPQNCEIYGHALVDFTAEEDWILEAGAVDDLLTAKIWRAGEPEPEHPQLIVRNNELTTGRIGVDTFHSASWPTSSQMSGSFDDIYFTPVPEPSCAALLLSAVFGYLVLFRQHGTEHWQH